MIDEQEVKNLNLPNAVLVQGYVSIGENDGVLEMHVKDEKVSDAMQSKLQEILLQAEVEKEVAISADPVMDSNEEMIQLYDLVLVKKSPLRKTKLLIPQQEVDNARDEGEDVVQSVLLSKEIFKTRRTASAWIKNHGFKLLDDQPVVTNSMFRFLQEPANDFIVNSFVTKDFQDFSGVEVVVAKRLATKR